MPPPRDLTGQRFGRLTVLCRDGTMKFGSEMPAWRCRCDCGAELRVPQKRLTTQSRTHQMHACESCRAVPCAICGALIALAAHAKTCSPECAAEAARRYQLGYYHAVRAADPDDTAKRRARRRARWAALTPEEKRAVSAARRAVEGRDVINARHRARHAERMAADPDYAEAKAAARAERAARIGPDAARAESRDHARRRRAQRAEIDLLRAMDTLRGEPDG